MKLSRDGHSLGREKADFLVETISCKGIGPIERKTDDFLKNVKLRTSVKSFQSYIGCVILYKQYHSKWAVKLILLYKLPQKDVKFTVTKTVRDSIIEINENVAKSATLTLRLPLPKEQLVILCDAIEHPVSYVLLTYGRTDTTEGAHKLYAPVAFCSRRFTSGQMSLTKKSNEFLANSFASDEFGSILWGKKKHKIVMTDKKAKNRFSFR